MELNDMGRGLFTKEKRKEASKINALTGYRGLDAIHRFFGDAVQDTQHTKDLTYLPVQSLHHCTSLLLSKNEKLTALWIASYESQFQPDPVNALVDIIYSTPALTVEVLQAAFFHSGGVIPYSGDTVLSAVIKLPQPVTMMLVTRYCLFNNYSDMRLWRKAMCVSMLAAYIASSIDGCDVKFCRSLGLLHDIGRIYLKKHQQKHIETNPCNDVDIADMEHRLMGFILARHYGIPTAIKHGIYFHQHPQLGHINMVPPNSQKEVLVIAIAAALASNMFEDGNSQNIARIHPSYSPLCEQVNLSRIMLNRTVMTDLKIINIQAQRLA